MCTLWPKYSILKSLCQAWWHRTLISALKRQTQVNLSGFKVSLVYIVSSRTPIGNNETLSQNKTDPPQKKSRRKMECVYLCWVFNFVCWSLESTICCLRVPGHSIFTEKACMPGGVVDVSFIPGLGRQRKVGLWVCWQPGLQLEFHDNQGYTEKLIPRSYPSGVLWVLGLTDVHGFCNNRDSPSTSGMPPWATAIDHMFWASLDGSVTNFKAGFSHLMLVVVLESLWLLWAKSSAQMGALYLHSKCTCMHRFVCIAGIFGRW